MGGGGAALKPNQRTKAQPYTFRPIEVLQPAFANMFITCGSVSCRPGFAIMFVLERVKCDYGNKRILVSNWIHSLHVA